MLKRPSIARPLQMVIADYDNGIVLLSRGGEVLRHLAVADGKAACGVDCSPDASRLVVLAYKVRGRSARSVPT